MSFRINTNVSALNAHTSSLQNNRNLSNSLAKLSSGLRINNAADDASGMAIADSLRSQASSLGQAINNANDGIGLIQTADKAMDEQLKILDTIKMKAVQAANDTQTSASREAIQKDVNRLIEQLDNIAKTTSFNGQVLLSGKYSNKEFQVGAFSNQAVNASINNTQSLAIGGIATTTDLNQFGNLGSLNVSAGLGDTNITLSTAEGLGVGDTIKIAGQNKSFEITGVNNSTATAAVITLDEALTADIESGTAIAVASYADNATDLVFDDDSLDSSVANGGTLSLTVASGDLTGFAVGDSITLNIITSGGTAQEWDISAINVSAGTVEVTNNTGSAINVSAAGDGAATIDTSVTLGTAFADLTGDKTNYVQYNVEGVELIGVQMTDEDGNGVANTGLGRVADLINETTDQTGVKAVADVSEVGTSRVAESTLLEDMTINGVTILEANDTLAAGDVDGKLTSAINAASDLTGVTASLTTEGKLELTSDGRVMTISGFSDTANIADGTYSGDLSLTKNNVEVMDVEATYYGDAALASESTTVARFENEATSYRLSDLVTGQRDSNGDGNVNDDDAVGFMMTKEGAMLAMDIAEAATRGLDATRADLGSVQNQLTVTVNNISVTQVNVKAAESQLRDVDFAAESAAFSKFNILAQSGSYAMSQANAVQQNVLRLLQ